jgi:prepilin-type N-terminal cleavage/methylation domain-containing protein
MRREAGRARRGFTLIEILVVVAIISVLSSIVLGGVVAAQRKARQALAQTFVAVWNGEVEDYYLDTGEYPGTGCPTGENGFPALFQALAGERPPLGKGGPSAPYVTVREEDVAVPDAAEGGFRRAAAGEVRDHRVARYIRDPWGNPYVYRENRSRPRTPIMKRPTRADLYSTGPDGIDQTARGEEGDDIGNW